MKAQAVNVDWVVGLSIFLVAVVATTINVVESSDNRLDSALGPKADSTADSLQSSLTVKTSFTPLYVRQPYDVGKVPYLKTFPMENSGSAYVNTASVVNISGNEVIAIVESGNKSYQLTKFEGEVNHGFSDNITGGERLENSYVSLDPERGGLESIRLNDKEYFEGFTDLGGSGELTETYGVYGSSFDKLSIYNDSKEIVFEDIDTTFHFKNFTELYWEPDKSTTTLAGEKEFESGTTQGLVLSGLEEDSYTATFTGDLDARVYQDSDPGTKVDIDSEEAHLMLQESSIDFGKKRIDNRVKGDIYFGTTESLFVATDASIQKEEGRSSFRFVEKYGLRGFSYNITGILNTGDDVPLQPVSVESRVVPKSNWNGTITWKDLKVSVWQ